MIETANAQLIISAAHVSQFPESQHAELVLAGRSNVGKSSFINALAHRKRLAYVGQRPGKTRLLNFYELNSDLMIVDVPGYGYANRSAREQDNYAQMMDSYFATRPQCVGALVMVDIRRGLNSDDRLMLDFLKNRRLPVIIVLTKSDKLSRSAVANAKRKVKLETEVPVVTFSNLDEHVDDEVNYFIERLLNQ